jgi:hypothetical protein
MKEREMFPAFHEENGSEYSKWWFLSGVFILSELGDYMWSYLSATSND